MIERKSNAKESICADFVGKQCIIPYYIQGQLVDALWVTGSQVCIVDELWKNEHLPNMRLRDVTEVIDAPEGLCLVAARSDFGLAVNETETKELIIPVLIIEGRQLCHPIIEFSVIEQMLNDSELHRPVTNEFLRTVLPSVEGEKETTFINQIQEETPCKYLVKTTKENVQVPKHTSVQLKCRLHI